jgi:membrane-bound lytic murein transglycosylase F
MVERLNYVICFLSATIIFFTLQGCQGSDGELEPFQKNPIQIDLPEILQKGKLTILAENSSTSFFIYRGKRMGFEYELLKEFCRELGVELEVKIVNNLDDLIAMLNDGEGDIIACNYTVTKERKRIIDFSIPFLKTPQVLIQRKPNGWRKTKPSLWSKFVIRDPNDLARKIIHVWKNSSYDQRLCHLQEEIGDTIFISGEEGQMSSEELIEMVAEGLIDYTVAEENIAKVNKQFFDNLDIATPLSVRQKIAFGLRKTSPLLKTRIDRWLKQFMSKNIYRYLNSKYFELQDLPVKAEEFVIHIRNGRLSNFDTQFKQAASKYSWDWMLLASIAYKESRFNPNAQGFGGAYGMMQFMPSIGPLYGVFPESTPEQQILGGMLKLAKDFKSWKSIPDRMQREKFTIATYNAGRSHVEDAQRLARKYGLDPLRWDDNVELMMLNLSKSKYYRDPVVQNGALRGSRTFSYVRTIYKRYLEWRSVYK